MVASLPSRGASPLIWLASAARTCCETSWHRSRTHGTIRARTTSFSRSFAKPIWQPWDERTRSADHPWEYIPGT